MNYKNKVKCCTDYPFKYLIPFKDRFNIIRKIKEECIDIYKYTLEECPYRKICISKKCRGRPLPWKSETASKYLKEFAKEHNLKEGEDYKVKLCRECKFYNECNTICQEVLDYINRNKSDEPKIIYSDTVDNFIISNNGSSRKPIINEDIPWDVLNERKKKIIKMYVFEKKSFSHIAKLLKIYSQANVKYEFYAALTKLSKYATMRLFIKNNMDKLNNKYRKILKEVFVENKSCTEVAKNHLISKQFVSRIINKIIKKYNIKWNVFVKKCKNKIIYNTARIFNRE